MTIIGRGDFSKPLPNGDHEPAVTNRDKAMDSIGFHSQIENDSTIVSDLIKSNQAPVDELKQTIQAYSGADLFDFILEDLQRLKKILFDPQSSKVIMTALEAPVWINKKWRNGWEKRTWQIYCRNLYQTILLQRWDWNY